MSLTTATSTINRSAVPDDGRYTAEQDVSFLVLRAFYNLRGMLDRMLAEHELDEWVRPGMGPILYALYEADDCTISDIAGRVQLAASTLTNTLKRMEKNRLVKLTKCSEDRRAVRVKLMPLARRLEAKMHELRREVRSVLHGDMSERQITQTKKLLTQMIEAMEIHEWESKHPRNKTKQ